MASTRKEDLTVYRVALREYIGDISGQGAKIYGGRWNEKGSAVLYASESISLALHEIDVNLGARFYKNKLSMRKIIIPSTAAIKSVLVKELRAGWRAHPYSEECRAIGRQWLEENKACVLEVPSAIIPDEKNYVLNPLHKDFKKIRFAEPEPLILDKGF